MNIRYLFPGVVGYSNLTDTPDFPVKLMESAVNSGSATWYETVSAPDGEGDNPVVNHDIRRGLNFGLFPEIRNSSNPDLAAMGQAIDFMYKISEPAVNDYKSRYYSYDAVDYFGWVMLKYREGDFFSGHTDASHDFPRQMSLVYYVNDDYEGGELEFPHIGLTIKPIAGELVIFPSNYLFLHSAKHVTKGTKYSIINFIN